MGSPCKSGEERGIASVEGKEPCGFVSRKACGRWAMRPVLLPFPLEVSVPSLGVLVNELAFVKEGVMVDLVLFGGRAVGKGALEAGL